METGVAARIVTIQSLYGLCHNCTITVGGNMRFDWQYVTTP